MGKEILSYYPELHSFPSFYSDGENDDDNLSSLMLDHYLPPKYSMLIIKSFIDIKNELFFFFYFKSKRIKKK